MGWRGGAIVGNEGPVDAAATGNWIDIDQTAIDEDGKCLLWPTTRLVHKAAVRARRILRLTVLTIPVHQALQYVIDLNRDQFTMNRLTERAISQTTRKKVLAAAYILEFLLAFRQEKVNSLFATFSKSNQVFYNRAVAR